MVRLRSVSRLLMLLVVAALLMQPFATEARDVVPASPVATPDTPAAFAGTPGAAPGPGDTSPDLYAAVAPPFRDGIEAATAGHLPRYAIDLTITPASATALTSLSGTVDLLFVNTRTVALDTLVFRLYANDRRYGDGDLSMMDVRVAGAPVTPELSVQDTAVTVPLPAALAPGAAIDVTYGFAGQVANDPAESFGMYTYSPGSGTLALAHWYPMLAGFNADGSWKTDPPSVNGDPIFSDISLYDVTVMLPSAWQLAATGAEIDTRVTGDLTRHHLVTGPVRDVELVADATLEHISQRFGTVTVVSWFNPDHADGARKVLAAGIATLRRYQPVLSDYPYTELDLVDVTVGNGAAGIEFPQLVFIGGNYYDEQPPVAPDVSYLETLVVHEVLHQWFYGLVGDDQYQHAFMDEALVNFLMAYFYTLGGDNPDGFTVCYLSQIEIPYLEALFDTGDVTVDTPTDDFPNEHDYVVAAYAKGSAAFNALRQEIGDAAFVDGLHRYVNASIFRTATPADMRGAFAAASGEDLTAFWQHWFDEPDGQDDFTPADLDADQQRLNDLLHAA